VNLVCDLREKGQVLPSKTLRTFHRYVRLGEYEIDWGTSIEAFGRQFDDAE
jgi:hypothetical protein